MQGTSQAIEGKVAIVDLHAQAPADLVHQRDVKAVDPEVLDIVLEGRIVGRRSDHHLARVLDPLPRVIHLPLGGRRDGWRHYGCRRLGLRRSEHKEGHDHTYRYQCDDGQSD